jgi:hypothetical protein
MQGRDAWLRAQLDAAVCRAAVPLSMLDARVRNVDADASRNQNGAPVDQNVEVSVHVERERLLSFRLQPCFYG